MMTASNINHNNAQILLQAVNLNKMILKLNIEQLEDEILAFEDQLQNAIKHPQNNDLYKFDNIQEKFIKLNQLKEKLKRLP